MSCCRCSDDWPSECFDTEIDSDLDWITLDIGMSDIVIQLRHVVLKAHKQLKSNTYKIAQLILKQTLFEFDHIGKKSVKKCWPAMFTLPCCKMQLKTDAWIIRCEKWRCNNKFFLYYCVLFQKQRSIYIPVKVSKQPDTKGKHICHVPHQAFRTNWQRQWLSVWVSPIRLSLTITHKML